MCRSSLTALLIWKRLRHVMWTLLQAAQARAAARAAQKEAQHWRLQVQALQQHLAAERRESARVTKSFKRLRRQAEELQVMCQSCPWHLLLCRPDCGRST